MSSHIYLRINALFVFLFIAVITAIATIFCLPTSAFAVTSVKHGWMALDSNKKPVLNGSQYVLSSGTAQPVQFITDAQTVKAVPAKSVVYLNNKKAGKATALIVGDKIPGFKDAFITTFTIINTIDISKASIANIANQTYTGGKISPGITVKYGNSTLKKDKDYKISYGANTNAGKGSVTIKGVGFYTGSKTVNFNIVKANLNKASISNIANQMYNGGKISPGVTVKYGKTTLKKDKDYKVSYGANTNVGKGSVTISGIGGYTGSATKNFNIVKADLGKASIDAIQARYADGFTRVTPPVTVRLNGRVLAQNVDYTVDYGDNKQPGQGSVVIKAKSGNFTGSKGATFSLVNIGDDLARYACQMSYSRRKTYKTANSSAYTGTDAYKKSGARRGCHSAMYGAYKGSGYWKKFKANNYDAESGYKSNKSRWRYLGKFVPGKRVTSKGYQLLPGDTLCGCRGGGYHTCMYVGKSIPIEIYYSCLKPRTDALKAKKGVTKFQAKKRGGDVGTPYKNIDFVSASYHTIFAGCYCTAESSFANYYGKNMKVYRLIQPDNAKYRAGNVVQ